MSQNITKQLLDHPKKFSMKNKLEFGQNIKRKNGIFCQKHSNKIYYFISLFCLFFYEKTRNTISNLDNEILVFVQLNFFFASVNFA